MIASLSIHSQTFPCQSTKDIRLQILIVFAVDYPQTKHRCWYIFLHVEGHQHILELIAFVPKYTWNSFGTVHISVFLCFPLIFIDDIAEESLFILCIWLQLVSSQALPSHQGRQPNDLDLFQLIILQMLQNYISKKVHLMIVSASWQSDLRSKTTVLQSRTALQAKLGCFLN